MHLLLTNDTILCSPTGYHPCFFRERNVANLLYHEYYEFIGLHTLNVKQQLIVG